jgi:hypothetical protein
MRAQWLIDRIGHKGRRCIIFIKQASTMDNMKPARPEDIPRATHESVQTFFGVEVRTYVLDDGRRIINAEDFHKLMVALNLMDGG